MKAQHSDINADMAAYIQERMERLITEKCGFEEGRVHIRLFDPAMNGKTGMEVSATPPLTEEEDARVLHALEEWNASAGGSPIIKEAKC